MNKLKKFYKHIIIIFLILLLAGVHFYYQKQITQIRVKEKEVIETKERVWVDIEERIPQEIENCQSVFNLYELDFKHPIMWQGAELAQRLPTLIAMQAFEEDDVTKCNYLKNKAEINPFLSIESCQSIYYFLKLVTELEQGMDCEAFIDHCHEKMIAGLDVDLEGFDPVEIKEAKKEICKVLCQSYQDKTPVIFQPRVFCYDPAAIDPVSYLNPETKEIEICNAALGSEIKFILAVATKNADKCLEIQELNVSAYCQFYFDKTFFISYQNEFMGRYCQNIADNLLFPNFLE